MFGIINRLPAIIMVAIIDMALAIIDMASAIVNMLTVIHAMVTAININIDINTRRFCFFPTIRYWSSRRFRNFRVRQFICRNLCKNIT